ncbi:beta-ketoacyl-ACP synthase II [Desulfomicrobium sp. ZS1]|jgi:3-oxoacyl-[acyl-carrier-protein] synthase II|uniref:beta-ketoacyl-ACP synthase II n=1 Tax=Desulfomicrobium sp. ZS1 TaxID=2952228 RepID=UPI0020B23E98|nr:beta-ketoacyl-ACP synthase II [Desulfomicrobium sp. ZS1]UTF50363.1 beta-ketoacyl-ACP synthase II [Desulfomicrobium sp. ZS1]
MIGKRVVITGLAAMTPIGNSLQESWTNLIGGVCGIGPITLFDCCEFDAKIAGELKNFDPTDYVGVKDAKRMDRFVQIAVAAGKQLMEDCKMVMDETMAPEVGVLLGCGLGGLSTIEDFHSKLLKSGPGRISPFYIPMLIANMASGQISIHTGAKGPNLVTTSACASGTHAIGYAYSDIKLGRVKACITGGVESTITPMGVSGFTAMKALSTRNDEPQKASRPFDADRTGFVIGEGAGLLMLEELEHALARGAKIYAEVVGYGASGDAYHIAAPEESGTGMAWAMKCALRDSELAPEQVTFVNAHGTSTKLNDKTETKALKAVFGDHAYKMPITANKSMIGHLLGAAGGAEAVFTAMSLTTGIVPGTINQDTPDPDCDLDYTPGASRKMDLEYGISNSFGFGGTNASIILRSFK